MHNATLPEFIAALRGTFCEEFDKVAFGFSKVIRNATEDLLDNLDDDVPFLNPCLRPGLQQVHQIAKAFEYLDLAAPAVPRTEATITEAFPDLAKPVSRNAAGVKFLEHIISRHQNVALLNQHGYVSSCPVF